ncbi:hypothetical protein ABK040_016171 [Willaertia magna]
MQKQYAMPKTSRFGFFLLALLLIASLYFVESATNFGDWQQDEEPKIYFKTVHLVPHSHLDVGWKDTIKGYYENRVRSIFENVLRAIQINPERRFLFVEIAFIEIWWNDKKVSQELKDLFIQFLREKKIELTIAGMTMPDEVLNPYYSVIHTISRGHQWVVDILDQTIDKNSKNLNATSYIPNSSWRIDPFGATSTLTRLYHLTGLKDNVIMRIPYDIQVEMRGKRELTFIWKMNDLEETKVLTNVLDHQYCIGKMYMNGESAFSYSTDDKELADIVHEQVIKYSLGFNQSDIILPGGCDFTYTDGTNRFERTDRAIKYINANYERYGYKIKYSLLSEYFDAIRPKTKEDEQKLRQVDFDFTPYFEENNAVWTGFYTSVPLLKQSIREAENYYRIAKTLFTLSIPFIKKDKEKILLNGFNKLDVLAVAIADMSHHDAITGTSNSWVNDDYKALLQQGIDAAKNPMKIALESILLSKSPSGMTGFSNFISPTFSYDNLYDKLLTMIETKSTQSIPLVIFNSLGWELKDYLVSMFGTDPLKSGQSVLQNICAYDLEGKKLPKQLSKLTEGYQFNIKVPKIPALGYTTVFLKACLNNELTLYEEETISIAPKKSHTISYGDLKITFCNVNRGISHRVGLCRIEKNGKTYKMHNNFMYYRSEEYGQPSGAYVFHPTSNHPEFIAQESDSITITTKNSLFIEIQLAVSKQIKQIIRIYDSSVSKSNGFDIEFNFISSVDQGQELVTRFHMENFLNSEKLLYCDKNGLETAKWEAVEKIPMNYLPMVFNCFLRDETTKTQVTFFISEVHGAASHESGQFEIMLHRRCLRDDYKGLDEALNDDSVVSTIVRMRLDENVESPDLRKMSFAKESLTFNLDPFVFTGEALLNTPNIDPDTIDLKKLNLVKDFTGLRKPLPDDLHIVNLEVIMNRYKPNANNAKTILQLHNLGSSDLDSMSVESLFFNGMVDKESKISETNLGTIKVLSELKPDTSFKVNPLSFKSFSFKQGTKPKEETGVVFKDQDHGLEWTFTLFLLLSTVIVSLFLIMMIGNFIYRQYKYPNTSLLDNYA